MFEWICYILVISIKGGTAVDTDRLKIMARNIKTAEFQDLITNSTVPVVVDFWAAWCAPCRAFATVIEAFSEEYNGKVIVGKVNVDEETKLAQQFNVMSIPTVLIFKGGSLVETLIGSRSLDDLAESVDKHIS